MRDTSTSGSTIFIEPLAVKNLQDEMEELKCAEKEEEYKVLSTLVNLILGFEREILTDVEVVLHLDFIFAKGKYSKEIMAIEPQLTNDGVIVLKNARHPLLGNTAVPFDFQI